MEVEKQCILVLIDMTPEGRTELIVFQTGLRESAQSWTEPLTDLKICGLSVAPELAIGDGALGFWKALEQQFGVTRHQSSTMASQSETLTITLPNNRPKQNLP